MRRAEYYRDKVAVVTGGASGIGLALAETMLAYGAAKVVLADFNDENLRREAARLNTAYPERVLGLHCDVTQEEDVKGMMQRAAEFGGGRLDLLFNNAGAGLGGVFDAQTNEDWEKAFALNFYGALYGIRAVLPIMRAQGGGHIIDIISGIALYPHGPADDVRRHQGRAERTDARPTLRVVGREHPGDIGDARYDRYRHLERSAAPPSAQSPAQSARTILAGVAKNERLVLGDDNDLNNAKHAFDPDAAKGIDGYLLNVARSAAAASGSCNRLETKKTRGQTP